MINDDEEILTIRSILLTVDIGQLFVFRRVNRNRFIDPTKDKK